MNIQEYAVQKSWKYQMDNSKGLGGWNNYGGGMDKPDWIVVVGRNRDSEMLDESNFEAALERLGGEGKNVAVERFGHWGCGWFELLLVNPKSKKHVKIAFEIHNDLQDYPLLDESDFCERESEYQSEYAENVKGDLAKALSKHFRVKPSTALTRLAYDLNMEAQAYYGNDACINVYVSRSPDDRDKTQLKNCMGQMQYRYKKSKVFQAIYKQL